MSVLTRLDKALSSLFRTVTTKLSPRLFLVAVTCLLVIVHYQVAKQQGNNQGTDETLSRSIMGSLWNLLRVVLVAILLTPVLLFGLGFVWGYAKIVQEWLLDDQSLTQRQKHASLVTIGGGFLLFLLFSAPKLAYSYQDFYVPIALGGIVVAAIRSAYGRLTQATTYDDVFNPATEENDDDAALSLMGLNDVPVMEVRVPPSPHHHANDVSQLRDTSMLPDEAEEEDLDTPRGMEPPTSSSFSSWTSLSFSASKRKQTSKQKHDSSYEVVLEEDEDQGVELVLDEDVESASSNLLASLFKFWLSQPDSKSKTYWKRAAAVLFLAVSVKTLMMIQQGGTALNHTVAAAPTTTMEESSPSPAPTLVSAFVPGHLFANYPTITTSNGHNNNNKSLVVLAKRLETTQRFFQSHQELLLHNIQELERRLGHLADRIQRGLETLQAQSLEHGDELRDRLQRRLEHQKLQLERAQQVAQAGLYKLQQVTHAQQQLLVRVKTGLDDRLHYHLEQAQDLASSVKHGVDKKLHSLQQPQRRARRAQWQLEEEANAAASSSFPSTTLQDLKAQSIRDAERVRQAVASIAHKLQKDPVTSTHESQAINRFFSNRLW